MPRVTKDAGAASRRDEVSRWWRADRRAAGPARAGAAGRGRVDRGRGQRPGGGPAVAGDADVGEPVATGAGRRWAGGAGLEGARRRPLQAGPGPAAGAGGGVGRRAGRARLARPVLDAGPDRRGDHAQVRRGLHPGRGGPAAAPDRLERAGPRPPGRRARRSARRELEGGRLAGDKRTAADLGAWLCFEDEAGQGLRPPKGRTWGRRGRTPVVRVTAANSPRLSLAAVLATKPGHRPRLIYRTHAGRRSDGRRDRRRKGLTEADYAALLDA